MMWSIPCDPPFVQSILESWKSKSPCSRVKFLNYSGTATAGSGSFSEACLRLLARTAQASATHRQARGLSSHGGVGTVALWYGSVGQRVSAFSARPEQIFHLPDKLPKIAE